MTTKQPRAEDWIQKIDKLVDRFKKEVYADKSLSIEDQYERSLGAQEIASEYWLKPLIRELLAARDQEWIEKVKGLKMKKHKEGKHDGHINDNQSWCYDCMISDKEEEFTSEWKYNEAVKEFNTAIDTLLEEKTT